MMVNSRRGTTFGAAHIDEHEHIGKGHHHSDHKRLYIDSERKCHPADI